MAETKTTRSGTGRPAKGSRNRARAGGSRTNRSASRSAGGRSASNRRHAPSSAGNAAKSRAQTTGTAVANAARKARTPVIAGGAALAGLAGGAALARMNGQRKLLGLPMPPMGGRPSTAKALATAAKEIGKTGYKVGQLTSEVRRVREEVTRS
jgi:hypothetical protein